jgi:hypothetical protein
MAITVLSGSPQSATPVYNKMLFKVSGSLTSGTNYRYVCDVKNAAGSTTLARLKCDKLPTTSFGFFDVSRVVETLIAPVKPTLAQVGFANHAGFYSGYRLTFMEEFGATPVVQTGTTTNVTGSIVFAGNLEQLELADWSGGTYFPPAPLTANTGKSLTTIQGNTSVNNAVATVYSDSHAFLCYGKGSANTTNAVRVRYRNANDTVVREFFVQEGALSGSSILRFGAGPVNLKALTSGQCSDNLAGSVNFPTAEGAGYSIEPVDTINTGLPYFATFYRIGPCQRFAAQPVHFVNKFGGIDSYTFTLKNRKRANVQRETYGYNSDVFATNTYDKVWNGSFDYVYALQSDYLTDAESAWLIELVRSSQVWLEINGTLEEAVVNTNTYQFVTRRNDRLQQLQIEIACAYKNSIL